MNIDINYNKNSFMLNENISSVCMYGDPNSIKNPLITICIPTYKRPDLIKRSIDSALSQKTTIPYLVYVLDNDDDFSELEIFNIIKSYNDSRLVYFKNRKNIGMGGNWNRCGELVNTKYFSFLHDDDTLREDYLEIISPYLKTSRYDYIFVSYEHKNCPFTIDNRENKKNQLIKKFIKKVLHRDLVKINYTDVLFLDNIFGPPTCGFVLKTDTFLQTGGFNMEYYPSLDWIYCLYLLRKYNCVKLNIVCGDYYWEKNESLKEIVLNQFTEQRKAVVKSLIENNFACKLYYNFLRKDFEKKLSQSIENQYVSDSFVYKMMLHFKSIKFEVR